MKHRILLIISLLCIAQPLSAAPVQLWFDQATAFYKEQQYDSAALYYENIVQAGTVNSTVYYNLGNTYFRLKKIGLALVSFERAKRLNPGDPDIEANIRFINASITDRIAAPEQSFHEQVLTTIHQMFSLQAQLWILFGGLCLTALLFIRWLFTSGTGRLWLTYGMILSGGLTGAVSLSASIKIYQAENRNEAVVVRAVVDARNQPNGPTIIFTAHEGTKFRIRQTEGAWVLCSLPNGVSGWVERDLLVSI